MGFAGNLSTLSLVEVFQTINRIRATGVLRLASAEAGRDVVFNEGEIIGVAFRSGEERQALLRRLILLGKIDAATAAAISTSGKDSSAVVEALISRELLSPEDVQEAVVRQSEDELYNLCTWEYADFVFHDAAPEDSEAARLVEQFKLRPLKLGVNSLLMEAARRMDEWDRLRALIPSEEGVLGAADGKDAELLAASREYPGSAVVPLIDAVRTVEDIVRDSVATRLDVYGVLVGIVKDGLVTWLTRDDLIAHAEYLAGAKDFIRAAHLYRRVLASSPSDHAAKERLAECLEELGSTPEAASCFAQLALGHLEDGNGDGAISAALRAVSLAEDDPRQRLILVRCLLEQGEKQEAIGELRKLAQRYATLGQLEDARGTCLKILELDPTNEDARREMARIFATAEKDPDSEDVVVCVQCGHVNHREMATCSECEAPLRLSCTGCGRAVAVSDKICIFCGANPHAGTERRARVNGSPATSRIIDPRKVQAAVADKGSRFWKAKIEEGVKKARALEEAGDYAAALAEWREVAKVNPDNAELQAHIRSLEGRANDNFTEQMIDRGHQLRRRRRFWSAIKSYQAALRAMPADDPRAARLHEILASTRRHHQRTAVIYAAAFALIGALGWMVASPIISLRRFRGDLESATQLEQTIERLAPQLALKMSGELDEAIARLDASVGRLGHGAADNLARSEFAFLQNRIQGAREQLAMRLVDDIRQALDHDDPAGAGRQLEALRAAYGTILPAAKVRAIEERLAAAKRANEGLERQRQQAPQRLAEVQAEEKAGALGKALAGYRELAKLGQGAVAAPAQEGLARLEPKYQAFSSALAQAGDLAASDLARAEAALAPLAEAARTWLAEDEYGKRREAVSDRLRQAAAAYQQLGVHPTQEALAQFIAAHRAAPQAAQARVRLDQLQQAAHSHDEQVAGYRAALAANHHEQAWLLARNLLAGADPPADILLPLVVESSPSGAEVRVGDQVRGRTPCALAFAPGDRQVVTVALADWQPVSRPVAELQANWRWQLPLSRQARWRTELGKPVSMIQTCADDSLLVLAGETLGRVDGQGGAAMLAGLSGGDDLADASRFHLAHPPAQSADGQLAVGLPGRNVELLDHAGAVIRLFHTEQPARGQPVFYTNLVFGDHPRLAFAADGLYTGEFGANQEPNRIPLPSPALSGPLVLATKDLDRVLVVATIQGHLVAFEESTRRKLWEHDLKATEVGQLLPAGTDLAVAVLDGSRLACFQVRADGAALRWTQALAAPALGDPVVSGGMVYLAAGAAVVRVGLDGVALPPLALPAPAATAVAAAGELAAVGCRNGQLMVFRRGAAAWASACEAMPGAVACAPDKVVVGLANGILLAYPP